MKVLIVHNDYGKFSGEEAVVESTVRLLVEKGHKVLRFTRSSEEIPNMPFGKTRAFFSSIYSFSSKKLMRKLLAEHEPDVVHIHNLFPLISPSVLGECRKAGVPVVMTVHNYRLICPCGLFMSKGRVCEKCSGGKEWWCFFKNCENNIPKSLGYSLRNYVAGKFKFYKDNVTIYACLTEFQRQKLIENGFAPERICVIPNMADSQVASDHIVGNYVAFVGRLSKEKGIKLLNEAASKLPEIAVQLAGQNSIPNMNYAPNMKCVGSLEKGKLNSFYCNSKFLVLPSICYEGFPMVLVEAMMSGKPVIASRIGGIPEIVDNGITGLLFEPGNADDLAEKINYLWNRPDLCRQMGQAARQKALREYTPAKYYERLMAVYRKAITLQRANGQEKGE